eukprot:COSAG04_NODE_28784_length_273_cov_0.885057_1_plen_38_part_10
MPAGTTRRRRMAKPSAAARLRTIGAALRSAVPAVGEVS